jgi:hypothetical protein
MNNNISRNVYSFQIDKSLKYCLIKFWPDRGNSEDEVESNWYYTIVEIPLLRMYGGVPERCEIKPIDRLNNSKYFDIESKFKPAIFEGLDYNCAKKGIFWGLRKSNPTLEDVLLYIKELFPSAEKEFKELINKHINMK